MHPDLIVNKTCSLTFNCNGETFVSDFEDVEFKTNIEYEEHPYIPFRLEKERSMNINVELTQPLDENLIDSLTNIKDMNDCNDCGLTFKIEEQVRKHKKKRINKKWLKRYGTRCYIVTVPYAKYLGQDDNKVYFVSFPEKKVKRMIEVDCRKCVHCTGEYCEVYGDDVDYATEQCHKDGFKNYIVKDDKK